MASTAAARWANVANIRANPRQADLAQTPDGTGGSTTAQLSNRNVVASLNTPVGTVIAPEAHNAPWAQPVPVWIALVVLMIIYHFVEEHPKSGVDKAEILHISVGNLVKVTILALIGLTLGKWIFGYWKVPGLSVLFAGV